MRTKVDSTGFFELTTFSDNKKVEFKEILQGKTIRLQLLKPIPEKSNGKVTQINAFAEFGLAEITKGKYAIRAKFVRSFKYTTRWMINGKTHKGDTIEMTKGHVWSADTDHSGNIQKIMDTPVLADWIEEQDRTGDIIGWDHAPYRIVSFEMFGDIHNLFQWFDDLLNDGKTKDEIHAFFKERIEQGVAAHVRELHSERNFPHNVNALKNYLIWKEAREKYLLAKQKGK